MTIPMLSIGKGKLPFMGKKPRKHDEDDLQIAVVRYLTLAFPEVLFFHCPSGGRRNIREAARFKQMGVIPGVADLLLFWNTVFEGIPLTQCVAIELKSKSGVQSNTQISFCSQWRDIGGDYIIARSIEEVRDFLVLCGLKPKAELLP